jgi:hypothetical protein
MNYNTFAPPTPPPPPGSNETDRFSFAGSNFTRIWTYRRAFADVGSPFNDVNEGDISQQNWAGGNDFDAEYVFMSLQDALATVVNGSWAGGINLNALSRAEQRAYGWYWFYKNNSYTDIVPYLSLNYTAPGTLTGLTKMPYLRDTRRSVGINGFRLTYDPLNDIVNGTSQGGPTGYRFPDTVCGSLSFFKQVLYLYVNYRLPSAITGIVISTPSTRMYARCLHTHPLVPFCLTTFRSAL